MASTISRQTLARLWPRLPHMTSNPLAAVHRPRKYGPGRAFSATVRAPAMGHQPQAGRGGSPSGDGVDMPAFSLKQLNLSPRMRRTVIALLCVAGCVEGATWYYVGPKFFGKSEETQQGQQS